MVMEISLMTTLIITLMLSSIALYIYLKQKERVYLQTIAELTQKYYSEKNSNKVVTYSFGKFDKYTDDDINKLKSNREFLKLVIKILSNFTILRTDSLRNPENRERINEVIGEANAFNEMIFFFYKLSLTEDELNELSK